MKRLIPLITVLAITAVVLIAAASGGGSKKSKTAANPYGGGGAPAQSAAASSAIDARNGPLGKTLVDSHGRTLYLFEADKTSMSNCSSACLSIWPALYASAKPQAKNGVLASKIGLIPGAGGKSQVTYNGHPLYYYAPDQKPGDTQGQGLNQFGAKWYVVATTGNKIDHD
jgi:predicted lipoprotein with Yx(FWY)xxD motif